MLEIVGYWAGVTTLVAPPLIFLLSIAANKVTEAMDDLDIPLRRRPLWLYSVEKLVDHFSKPVYLIPSLVSFAGWGFYGLIHMLLAVGAIKEKGEELTFHENAVSPVQFVSEAAQWASPVVTWVAILMAAYFLWSYAAVGYAKFFHMSLKLEDKMND